MEFYFPPLLSSRVLAIQQSLTIDLNHPGQLMIDTCLRTFRMNLQWTKTSTNSLDAVLLNIYNSVLFCGRKAMILNKEIGSRSSHALCPPFMVKLAMQMVPCVLHSSPSTAPKHQIVWLTLYGFKMAYTKQKAQYHAAIQDLQTHLGSLKCRQQTSLLQAIASWEKEHRLIAC
ncbi:hypothetical protein DM01DRAFT_1216949 [Hesseltinella vesiculosa]|uniref:Uncharacterized protein n=1 Tax=Hesseltinella vesiculosa TaxID=101127 RepID=A0A1X2GNK9_9FUNG|nr:hypothetical protein DM01DRAFT_1216949 [Hesseltinella vesiculosa]